MEVGLPLKDKAHSVLGSVKAWSIIYTPFSISAVVRSTSKSCWSPDIGGNTLLSLLRTEGEREPRDHVRPK